MVVQTSTTAVTALGPEGPGWAKRVLACIDDDAAGAVIMDWIRTLPVASGREVILLGLMPKPEVVRTRGILLNTVRTQLREMGLSRIAAMTPDIERVGIKHHDRVELFDGAEDILTCAQEERADVIVIVGRHSGLSHRQIAAVFRTRSLAARVADISDIPVVVLKQAVMQ